MSSDRRTLIIPSVWEADEYEVNVLNQTDRCGNVVVCEEENILTTADQLEEANSA